MSIRSEFEKWASLQGMKLSMNFKYPDLYFDDNTNAAWRGFSAGYNSTGDRRVSFEIWADRCEFDIIMIDRLTGDYVDELTKNAWRGFLAGRAAAPQPKEGGAA